MNIIFAGTPEFSAWILQALIQSNHLIKAVYTQPDRPAGRGRKLTASPVKQLGLEHGLSVFQPVTLRNEQEQKTLAELNADMMVVVAYGLILPAPVLRAPKWGCINVHASLLPRWRGAAPIQRAILAGDTETGITIMQMDEGLDTGDMLYKVECPLHETDTSAILHDRLAELGANSLLKVLNHFEQFTPAKQNQALATYAHKIKKEEAQIDWHSTAEQLSRCVRAFNPWPVAFSGHVRIWEAQVLKKSAAQPGVILQASSEGIDVSTGQDVLRILKLQLPGGKVLTAREILNAHAKEFEPGKLLV